MSITPPCDTRRSLVPESPQASPQTRVKDGRAWRIGTEDVVAWVNAGVTTGLSITAAVPPVFAAYAMLAFPVDLELDRDAMRPAEDRFDDAVLSVLCPS